MQGKIQGKKIRDRLTEQEHEAKHLAPQLTAREGDFQKHSDVTWAVHWQQRTPGFVWYPLSNFLVKDTS